MPRTDEVNSWHEGELFVQERAGVGTQPRGIRSFIPERAMAFLLEQQFAVLSWSDAEGHVWASLRTGPPGFLSARDERTIEVAGESADAGRMLAALAKNPQMGVLVIDFASRRRMRVNGDASVAPNSNVLVHTTEVYSNCPQYIQARSVDGELTSESPALPPKQGKLLLEHQRKLIERADTFFIASLHPQHGADASHRGGNPGFVKVVDNRTLWIPDYSGNNMFNTLGNIQSSPNAGLLFVDFANGTTLQLSGTATIIWDRELFKEMPGARRVIEFKIAETRESSSGMRLRFKFQSYSSVNPK